jgi:hypothetical protein
MSDRSTLKPICYTDIWATGPSSVYIFSFVLIPGGCMSTVIHLGLQLINASILSPCDDK